MNDEDLTACVGHLPHEITHKLVRLGLVDPNAMFDGHGHIDHIQHGLDPIGHSVGLVHEACAKRTALHPLRGATAIQIDFVVAPLLTQPCGMGQIGRLRAA